MEIKNIILAASYLEFVNEIDSVVYELLYSSDNGYTLLTSKDAVEEAENVIEKYNTEVQKIIKKVNFENANEVIEDKRKELIVQVNKHYKNQALIWAQNVYEDVINNCLLSACINKDNKQNTDKLYNRALCAISWIKEVKNLSDSQQSKLVEKFNNDFFDALYSNDNEKLLNQSPEKSDINLFLELRELIINDEDYFNSLDMNEFSNKLNKNDLSFLNKIKYELKTYKKTSIKDEINLIDSALELINFQNKEDKYNFIQQVNDDFALFYSTNKRLNEEDKVNLIKKRINIYKDKNSKYYKKILTSALNE